MTSEGKAPFEGIQIDSSSSLFNKAGMSTVEFQSDFQKIRYYTGLIVRYAPGEIKEFNLLEQQVSELIKNAIKHGNKSNPAKKIRVYYSFGTTHAHLIVKDEGKGFAEIEQWNEFYQKRMDYFRNKDFEHLAEFLAYRSESSDESDGGNALFAAVEYWNDGVVFSDERNSVAVRKRFIQAK